MDPTTSCPPSEISLEFLKTAATPPANDPGKDPGKSPGTLRTKKRESSAKRPATWTPPPNQEKNDFVPREPSSLQETGLTEAQVEALVLKVLFNVGSASGRQIAGQVKLPFGVVNEILAFLKSQLLVMYRGSAGPNDFEYVLSDKGMDRARRLAEQCTYFGAAPVNLEQYVEGIERQSVLKERPKMADIQRALADMMLPEEMVNQIGQAINFGRGFFIYGAPGNGKTSIAERVVQALGKTMWIPRTVSVTGEYIRLFDPSNHVEIPLTEEEKAAGFRYDTRWVRIERPTIVVGGELQLQHLDISTNIQTGINEAPFQMKSNGGALVIDDFGRQRVSTSELLNRWIVPLEKQHDYLCLPSGRQVQIPFEQLLIFATNLEPRDLVDEAFLRRIPFKIEVHDPTEKEFKRLFALITKRHGFRVEGNPVDHLFATHYHPKNRPLRYCHARDLLGQAKNYCEFLDKPLVLDEALIDRVIANYFAGL